MSSLNSNTIIMKSIGSINSILLLIVVMALNGCKKKENDRGAGASYFKDACISVDKTGAKKGETITVSNCGVVFSTNRATPEIAWGDGQRTSGQTGSHQYASPGTYTVELFIGQHSFTKFVPDASKVKKTVVITE